MNGIACIYHSSFTIYRSPFKMRHPWINLILFILLFVQIITGYLGLTGGDETFRWVLWLHGIGGYGLVVLLYWKSDIILYAIRRKKRWTWHRILFAFTGLLLLITLNFWYRLDG